MPVEDSFDWLKDRGEDASLLFSTQSAFSALRAVPATIGLAVSGGGDSIAMLHLMAEVAAKTGRALRIVTVNHGLRAEAADEAAFVAAVAEGLGLPQDVLRWEHGEITGNLMERAREARYRLIADWARRHGIADVALAHTADDDAEGFLIGLSRAAGLEGLSGMRQCWTDAGVTFHRPFLGHTREELRGFLRRHGLSWIEDPTNENDRFTRTKARRALRSLRPLGITVERLATVVRNLAMAEGVVSDTLRRAAQGVVTEAAGALTFERRAFLDLGPELDRLLLGAMLRWMTGATHAPRADGLRNLHLALVAGRDATLAGCRFRHRDGVVTVSREVRAVGVPVLAGELWDGRWRVEGAAGEVRALGAAGLRQCPDWRALGLARQVLEVTPGVWRGDTLVAAPSAGFGPGTATCAPSFHAHLLSH